MNGNCIKCGCYWGLSEEVVKSVDCDCDCHECKNDGHSKGHSECLNCGAEYRG